MRTLYESILDTDFDIKEPEVGFPCAEELTDIFMDNKWVDYDVNPKDEHWAYRYTGNGNAIIRDFKYVLTDINSDLYTPEYKNVQRDALVIFKANRILIAYLTNKETLTLQMCCNNIMQPTYIYINRDLRIHALDYKYKNFNFKVPHQIIDTALYCLQSKKR